jgi:hypothetical protein
VVKSYIVTFPFANVPVKINIEPAIQSKPIINELINFANIIFHLSIGFEQIINSVPSIIGSLKIDTTVAAQTSEKIIITYICISINVLLHKKNGSKPNPVGRINSTKTRKNQYISNPIITVFFLKTFNNV